MVVIVLLMVAGLPATLRADLTLNSGTTTIGSSTNVGTSLFVARTGTAALDVTGGSVTGTYFYLGWEGTWAVGNSLNVGYNSSLTMSGGLVSVAGRLSKGAAGTISLNHGGTLQIGVGSTTGMLDVPSLVNNGTLTINRSNLFNYEGVISGSGVIVKQGGGQWRLAGANTYSGVTTIAGSTLILAGTGSIGTGGLNLGTTASPGTVTVDNGFTLDLANSGTSLFEITSPIHTAGTFDLVNGPGSVVFGGVLELAFTKGPYANGSDVLTIVAATGGFSGDFSSVVASGLDAGQYATFNPATGTISVVPEPATYALALIGITCGGRSLRRRRNAGKIPLLFLPARTQPRATQRSRIAP